MEKHIQNGINKIGVIFNIDPHYKEGSHWVAMFIDVRKEGIYYFDSYGERIPHKINKFGKDVIQQGKRLKLNFEFIKNKKRHQYKESECGMYSLFIIIQMIKGKQSFEDLANTHITDERMLRLRKEYFNF